MRIINFLKPFNCLEVPNFARNNFKEYFINSDKVMILLFLMQWFIATFITSVMYDTYLYGFFSGGILFISLLVAFRYFKGTRTMRALVAISMMLFSLIFIQQHLGRIEMHFHVFIAMAILTLYKDTLPIIIAAATTILHHLVFNYLQYYEISAFDMPIMVFNYGCGIDIVILHAIFVVVEMLILTYMIQLQVEHSIELHKTEKEVVELNEKLHYSSMHDSLTGLANRQYLYNHIELITANANRHKDKFALLFLDLDKFKNINDTLGHDIGDGLLKAIAIRLKNILRENDIIARIGGDEFIIVLSDIENEKSILECINKILDIFKKEIVINGNILKSSTSIGCSIYPNDSTDINELMKYADMAMYSAKENGRNTFEFFTKSLNENLHNFINMIEDMDRALNENEFKLYYQAKVDVKTEKIMGAEALIRWEHHEKGIIFPDKFIGLAESSGFIIKLGKFILNESAAFISKLNSMGYKDTNISINISSLQAKDLELYYDLVQIIETYSIDTKQLSVEITESVMMENKTSASELLNKIKELGINIYLDDFGTGYSSLQYLQTFPIDIIKIDKSFVDKITSTIDKNIVLLNTILLMGQTLGIKVIAEGVEDNQQLKYLKEKNCDFYQGYLKSKPLPEDEFIKLLQKDLL
ncbi:MAG: diguanylate cyclase [Sulfurimonas sp. RIFOXYD12_FULL_33_39]|uniref:putative bifunctional diguanylate cyclase/phosphodiesterase n=1 Tax=unclassified Sulfurimonas TaxID=2623549 RepID=UPI0008C1AD60|nr:MULTISPECIES: EAL domain-containing protein [unclassified Sulfurimonas]OHE07562.1 MAG: diguanylate cyclase [Sulfurimonas sp. RIFCSPLOWO2_12_FULL_34_6]OHE08738.1 MAG: diguanylate cyclase [Sulfurimonas sp. RIFOXYD12_FULL_33_39]OHE14023.1 MAG: diguanylate cyclase [Sulfurimonas sp. RIFOXYD2_FULL_34_21]